LDAEFYANEGRSFEKIQAGSTPHVDEEDVTPRPRLGILGESIDFLDIVFRLEKAFDIKIPARLFPKTF
jgi:acyl carrier protein